MDPIVGIDVGSTTVKVVAVHPDTRRMLWMDYERHEARQPHMVRSMLGRMFDDLPDVSPENVRAFVTGSGGAVLAEALGAKFVQEVNAVTLAVEHLHPDAGSVVELGGQDAKIIIFKENEKTGERYVTTSMNDKCASGTGATIDKCLAKVGLPIDRVRSIEFDPGKLHHVAAKCGVFAETDIVTLTKSGIPAHEIINSLADAIVVQNLSVLTRGNTLRHRVYLLGGPNTYLPFLQACWRMRIREAWHARGYRYPEDEPIENLVVVPDNAQYYAAYGAAAYSVHEPATAGVFRGLESLDEYINRDRKTRLGDCVGPPVARTASEVEAFREQYRIPEFVPASFRPGTVVRAALGLDGGSTSSKCVLVDEDGNVLRKEYQLSRGNPIQDMQELFSRIRDYVQEQQATLEIIGFGVTGYAGDVMERALNADANIVETVAHTMSAVHYFPDVDVICDIGGQDIKVLFLHRGNIKDFRLSNQCSAGNGMLLQAMADQFGVSVTDYADIAFEAEMTPRFTYGCAVFLDSDRVTFQKDGYSKEEILAGLALVLPKNVWQYVVQIPRLGELGRKFVLQGGTQHNLSAVKAQVDYVKGRVPDADIVVHPHCGEAGAIGAAMHALQVVRRRGHSNFVGLENAIDVRYASRNDASTRCGFCPNNCSRTFIDTETPSGQIARYIAGFSCERGTVEDLDALRRLNKARRERMTRYPNLVEVEARLCFKSLHEPAALPESGTPVDDVRVERTLLGAIRRRPIERPFRRSSQEQAGRRQDLRIGIPRVLNLWSTGPFWRAYFETLGLRSRNIVFSDETSRELWLAGGKYGSVDPCYPSKVCQAHIHNLLFRHHEKHPLHYIFFPSITHIPSHVVGGKDTATCPVVAGTPNVVRAAFTKEVDFFSDREVEYVDVAVTMAEPAMLRAQMFEAWGERLGVTEDENDFAVDQGFAALRAFDEEMQSRGKRLLEELEENRQVGVLMIGRPYHNDPGLNHDIMSEFQALGYPVLSMRSIPKDPEWLQRYFADDLRRGFVEHPLAIDDVWPESYSVNSMQKVWAAKFAARHPNLAVLDLSSFKCGHDAPIYGLVDSILSTAKRPFLAYHDLDANKPAGSIKIRVRTYAHRLEEYEEQLRDNARKEEELERRLAEKRLALLEEMQRRALLRGGRVDFDVERRIDAARAVVDATRRKGTTSGRDRQQNHSVRQ